MGTKRIKTTLNAWSRKVHRWGAIATAAPLIVVVTTGILLLLKKEFDWIQPATIRVAPGPPAITFEQILDAVRSIEQVGVRDWSDVRRLDMRLRDGVVKVQCEGDWEVQVCAATGAPLKHAIRRSDLIESIHDGSWFHPKAKYVIFLPSAIIVLTLWLTGLWLWLMPYLRRKRTNVRG